jgi:hypothetical protein
MTTLLKFGLMAALVVFCAGELNASLPVASRRIAIIERVSVPAFLIEEQKANVDLSASSDLVSYRITESKQWFCRYSLIRQANGTARLTIPQYDEADRIKSTAVVELDAVLTNNLLQVVENILTRTVYAPRSATDLGLGSSHGRGSPDVIFFRAKGNLSIAGIVRSDNRHMNRGDLARTILWLGFSHVDDRSAIVAQLDRDTAVFVQTGRLPEKPMQQ